VAIIDHGKIVVTGRPGDLKKNLGGDVITLAIKEGADVTELIRGVEHVKEVRKENGSYRIKAELGRTTAPLIIEALRSKGYTVTRLSLSEPTLNDVYLEYTGRSMRDAEESPEAVRAQRMLMRRARA
jgi:ABC-2 type transport system ATP-binding protein